MKFRDSLKRRMAQAEQLQRRYRDDPAYRLHKVNYSRARRGNEPLSCVSEVITAQEAGAMGARVRWGG